MSKPFEQQNRMLEILKEKKKIGKKEFLREFGKGKKSTFYYNLEALEEKGLIKIEGKNVIYLAEEKIIEKLRLQLYYLRNPTIDEIAIEFRKTPESIKDDVYKIAKEIFWSEPNKEDIEKTKKWSDFVNASLKIIYQVDNGFLKTKSFYGKLVKDKSKEILGITFPVHGKLDIYYEHIRDWEEDHISQEDRDWLSKRNLELQQHNYLPCSFFLHMPIFENLYRQGFIDIIITHPILINRLKRYKRKIPKSKDGNLVVDGSFNHYFSSLGYYPKDWIYPFDLLEKLSSKQK